MACVTYQFENYKFTSMTFAYQKRIYAVYEQK